jgi:predicted metal-dependent phosphoesterase TrpH
MACKVDFHTHSTASPDGSLTLAQYGRMITTGNLNVIAITDHNTITAAQKIQRELGQTIIVGEEIATREGEIIGLYLDEVVPARLSAAETVKAIKKQGGLVYVPHPFETVRKGMTLEVLDAIAKDVDIIEVHNGRAVFQNYSKQALVWAKKHDVVAAAASDAHGRIGWGKTYTILAEAPTRQTLLPLLREASFQRGFPGVRGVMYPKFNRLRKKGRHA